jgi:Tfp pilus assembly protein PilX
MMASSPASQHGAALISIIFLIVVIAILGAVVVRTTSDQQHIEDLSLLETRVNAAAFSGVEYASNRIRNGALACPTAAAGVVVPLPAAAQTNGITVRARCGAPINSGVGNIHDISATASYGAFGNLDYVQRTQRRRVSAIGTGSW